MTKVLMVVEGGLVDVYSDAEIEVHSVYVDTESTLCHYCDEELPDDVYGMHDACRERVKRELDTMTIQERRHSWSILDTSK